MNNYTLHKLPERFIITSDEEINEKGGDLYYDTLMKKMYRHRFGEGNIITQPERFKKVIAQQDQIDFSALSEEEQKEIRWFDVEKIAKELLPDDSDWQRRFDVIKGFNAHKELVKDRLFTVEDMYKMWDAAVSFTEAFHNLNEEFFSKEEWYQLEQVQKNVQSRVMNKVDYLKSLLPSTEWDVEFDEQGKLKLI